MSDWPLVHLIFPPRFLDIILLAPPFFFFLFNFSPGYGFRILPHPNHSPGHTLVVLSYRLTHLCFASSSLLRTLGFRGRKLWYIHQAWHPLDRTDTGKTIRISSLKLYGLDFLLLRAKRREKMLLNPYIS